MGERACFFLTTLFRPFLSPLDSAVKTVNTSVSYKHSQVSRVSIAPDANSLCNVWKFLCLRIRYPVRASVFLAVVYSNKRGRSVFSSVGYVGYALEGSTLSLSKCDCFTKFQ